MHPLLKNESQLKSIFDQVIRLYTCWSKIYDPKLLNKETTHMDQVVSNFTLFNVWFQVVQLHINYTYKKLKKSAIKH